MKVLELYSGIGGMHWALKTSGIPGEIRASIDINPTANTVYKHNFPHVRLLNRNIQSLTPKFINELEIDTILMSPPCQPFTRNGLQGDVEDERTKSFIHILEILRELNIERILVENVVGFEVSQMRDLLVITLSECGFVYQEFIVSPTQIGVPNSRNRYFCIAKKSPKSFNFETGRLKTEFPLELENEIKCTSIAQILDENEDLKSYYLEDKILKKYLYIVDIRHANSTNSCCFTKAYSRYIEGTGSVFTEERESVVEDIFKRINGCDPDSDQYLKLARELRLRFFTPKEVSRLMSFPETFTFPDTLKNRQKYMLLGNSINVKVVAELIKLLK